MSFPHECPACYRGDHDRHNRGHGLTPGLIGGTYCPCTGECATEQRPNPLDQLLAAPGGDPLESADLLVLDPADPELVERIAWLFWLKLQDYMPGLTAEDWQEITERMRPEIADALAGGDPS
jgi:hypothetical protein